MKAGFLEKLVAKIDRLDSAAVQVVLNRLLQEKGYFVQVFQALREGVILLDGESQVSFINHAACRFFGLDAELSPGRKLGELIRGLDWEALWDQECVVSREMEVFYPESRYLHFYLSPIHSGTADGGYVMIVNDVTSHRAQTEKAIESERLSTLTLLAAGVAHEIGNPLNSLGIHLQLLERKLNKLPESKRKMLSEHVDTTRREVQRLDGILKQFLQAIRPTTPQRVMLGLPELLKDSLRTLEPELEERGVSVLLDIDEGLPPLELDPVQMQQVFHNLLRNAVQAISSGRGGRIQISIHGAENEILLRISDNGSGIPQEQMGVLFEPFRSNKSEGSGLGLLIVRRIVREHGGDLKIESREGSGTAVTISLPLGGQKAQLLPAPEEIIDVTL
jgi:PAS domain S-box-containing protein